MNWIPLSEESQLDDILTSSSQKPCLIFKHSTRCSISSMALSRLERSWPAESTIATYFLDLIAFRSVSNAVAEKFGVHHESPQAILVHNGKATYNASHNMISAQEITEQV